MKRAVINVQSKDNACFAWAVVAALHPAERNAEQESSYPHYTTVLNLQDIEFPMTLNQIKKFELHNISINVYCIEKENSIVPIRLSMQKKDRHVNLLYMQDSQDVGHFAWIKNLSRLVSSQLSKNMVMAKNISAIGTSDDKLQSHIVDCREMNECAIRLPSDKDKWLAFNNYNRKERLPFVVYVDLECVLRKTDGDPMASTYTFQHHQVFSVAYYVHFFHNLSGYDSHFIIKEIATAFEGSINVLPITKEKYISFTKHVKDTAEKSDWRSDIKLRFIDSYKFLNTSLEKLASFLNNDKLQILKSKFQNLSIEEFNLLTRNSVFPYEYIDCVDRLHDTCLPPRESYYSSLTGDTVSESDYAHAENVWKRFSVRTLGEYSDLYLKTDVLLLADVFENFRNKCIESYGLDPAYYYTLPGYTWDAMLKHTNITFELLTDIDMVMFIERGIRGGLSQCSSRYTRANNKYMPSYNPSKPSSYMMYFDVNNLYGLAMCQPLSYADFRWVDDISDFDVSAIASDSTTGYILEIDLEYPQHLHDAHADLPFCPTRDKPPGKRKDKLLATLYDKKRYVVHYSNLQQCTRHGLRIAKIHRVLQFAQSAWLRDYIELNTRFKTRATNDFEKNLYKLMNNAVFGKTMENVRNHVDVKLLTKWGGRYGAEAMIAKPNFHSRSVFSENLVAVELRNLEVKFNKPIYVGMCILDISKVCLYEFHHEYMLPLYRKNCKIMYTDTYSLIYHIECEDVYENMKRDIARFDTSDYPANNAYGIPLENKKVPGLMKDENNGAIQTEFVGLRAKMYALRVNSKKDTKKVKSVKRTVIARTITFDDYTQCLRDEIEMTRQQSCIRL
ncbi:uncharacterized protein [Polyergus mexicanus]|uniref:uncharacterized protein n=1 Tax=Polyergus mexicanus TaxID=615972 RepID=UPI0038B4FC70